MVPVLHGPTVKVFTVAMLRISPSTTLRRRVGMLVINSAFQRFAMLDGGETIAIETTSDTSPEQTSVEQLDGCEALWESLPNTLLVPSPADSTVLEYHVPAQKRYIRILQYMYYIGACADVPPAKGRSSLPIPRALQGKGTTAPVGHSSETFGPGIPKAIPQPPSASPSPSPTPGSTPIAMEIPGTTANIVQAAMTE